MGVACPSWSLRRIDVADDNAEDTVTVSYRFLYVLFTRNCHTPGPSGNRVIELRRLLHYRDSISASSAKHQA